MVNTTANSSAILTVEQVGDLIVRPVTNDSIAAQVSKVVNTSSSSYRVPIVTADPTAAWVAEGQEIAADDLDLTELDITFSKLAGLTVISSELAADSSPEAAQEVGAGLSRDLVRKVDQAYFGALASPAPSGLGALSGITAVSAGAAYANLDPFAEAIAKAEEVGATVGAFVTTPAVALTLAKLKVQTGSNQQLLGTDPTSPTSRTISGVPLLVSPTIAANTVWAIPRDRALFVLRNGAEVTTDGSVFFTSDRIAVRAKLRVGFGFPHPAAIVKITTT